MKFDIWVFFLNKLRKLISWKSDENSGYFTWTPIDIFLSYFAQFFLEWEMLRTKVVEKINTHILCLITFSRKSCRLWNNVGKYGKARQDTNDNVTRCMRFICWQTMATNTHSEYVILIAFTLQQLLRQYTLMLSLYILRLSSAAFYIKVLWFTYRWLSRHSILYSRMWAINNIAK